MWLLHLSAQFDAVGGLCDDLGILLEQIVKRDHWLHERLSRQLTLAQETPVSILPSSTLIEQTIALLTFPITNVGNSVQAFMEILMWALPIVSDYLDLFLYLLLSYFLLFMHAHARRFPE